MKIKGNIQLVQSEQLAAYLTDTGAADAYAVTLRPVITAYTSGLEIIFKAVNANTGASTLAVNGLAAKSIKKSVSSALAAGDILAGQIVSCIYDGTNFQLASGAGSGGSGSTDVLMVQVFS